MRALAIILILLVSGCAHVLKITSDPAGADVYVSKEYNSQKTKLGQTPLELDFEKDLKGGGGFFTLSKSGHERIDLYLSKGSFGSTQQSINLKLPVGDSVSNKSTKLMSYIRQSQRYLESLDYGNAHTQIDKAIELDPAFSFAYNFKAGIYFLQKKYTEAENYYNQALVLHPNDPESEKMLRQLSLRKRKTT